MKWRLHNLAEHLRFWWYRYIRRDRLHLMGRLSFTAYEGDVRYDGHGQIVNRAVYQSPTYNNLVVTAGKDLALDRLFGLSSAVAISSVGVGTDSTAAAATQTKLNPGVAGSVLLQTADASPATSRTAETVTIQATFATGSANFNWNECGLFNGNTNGTSTMFNRIVIGAFNKTLAVSIVLQLQITQA